VALAGKAELGWAASRQQRARVREAVGRGSALWAEMVFCLLEITVMVFLFSRIILMHI